MERKAIQTTLEDFSPKNIEDRNREAISNIRKTHNQKMAAIFDEIFQKIFGEQYTKEV